MTRAVCPECRGSGMRSCNGREFECFDCGGEGMWEAEPEEGDTGITLAELREKYGSQLTEVRGDPLLNKRRAA